MPAADRDDAAAYFGRGTSRLASDKAGMEATIAAQEGQIAALAAQVATLTVQIAQLQRDLYGSLSERRREGDGNTNRLCPRGCRSRSIARAASGPGDARPDRDPGRSWRRPIHDPVRSLHDGSASATGMPNRP